MYWTYKFVDEIKNYMYINSYNKHNNKNYAGFIE